MSTTRKIRLVNSNLGKAKTIETDVDAWGELKSNPEVSDMYRGDVKAVVRENQTTLEADTASLPDGKLTDDDKDYDFTLFFVTKKSKAGASNYDDRNEWTFQDLRREVANRGMNNNGKNRNQLIADLRRSDSQRPSGSEAVNEAVNEVILALLEEVNAKVDALMEREVSTEEVVDTSDDEPTEEEMEAARSIASMV